MTEEETLKFINADKKAVSEGSRPQNYKGICNIWSYFDTWPLLSAVNLILEIHPFATENITGDKRLFRAHIYQMALSCYNRSLIPADNPDESKPVYPSLFLDWCDSKEVDIPPELSSAVRSQKDELVLQQDDDPCRRRHRAKFKEKWPNAPDEAVALFMKMRNSQRYQERCKALANYFWRVHPNYDKNTMATLQVSIKHPKSEQIDVMRVIGCENDTTYETSTIEKWIKGAKPKN